MITKEQKKTRTVHIIRFVGCFLLGFSLCWIFGWMGICLALGLALIIATGGL